VHRITLGPLRLAQGGDVDGSRLAERKLELTLSFSVGAHGGRVATGGLKPYVRNRKNASTQCERSYGTVVSTCGPKISFMEFFKNPFIVYVDRSTRYSICFLFIAYSPRSLLIDVQLFGATMMCVRP